MGEGRCAFFSVHQLPGYPGSGGGHHKNAYNYPVEPGASRAEYRAALAQALEDLRRFQPTLLGVSAGFDAYRGDPLSHAALEQEDFHWLGKSIREIGAPSFSILEGGYSPELPDLVLAYLRGWAGV